MKLSTYISRRFKEVDDSLFLIGESKEREAIHDLRMALKRVFALQKILKVSVVDYTASFKPHFRSIKTVYKLCGIMRDNQLMKEYAKTFLPKEHFPNFSRHCNRLINKAHSQLKLFVQENDINAAQRKLVRLFAAMDILNTHFVLKKIEDRVVLNEGEIVLELAKTQSDYHAVRRWVKEQYYLMVVLRDVFKAKVEDDVLYRKKDLGSLLGKWHDLKVLESCFLESKMKIPKECIGKLSLEIRSIELGL